MDIARDMFMLLIIMNGDGSDKLSATTLVSVADDCEANLLVR